MECKNENTNYKLSSEKEFERKFRGFQRITKIFHQIFSTLTKENQSSKLRLFFNVDSVNFYRNFLWRHNRMKNISWQNEIIIRS